MELNFRKNLGDTDRVIRVTVGLILLWLVTIQKVTGWWAGLAVVFAVFQFLEAYFSY